MQQQRREQRVRRERERYRERGRTSAPCARAPASQRRKKAKQGTHSHSTPLSAPRRLSGGLFETQTCRAAETHGTVRHRCREPGTRAVAKNTCAKRERLAHYAAVRERHSPVLVPELCTRRHDQRCAGRWDSSFCKTVDCCKGPRRERPVGQPSSRAAGQPSSRAVPAGAAGRFPKILQGRLGCVPTGCQSFGRRTLVAARCSWRAARRKVKFRRLNSPPHFPHASESAHPSLSPPHVCHRANPASTCSHLLPPHRTALLPAPCCCCCCSPLSARSSLASARRPFGSACTMCKQPRDLRVAKVTVSCIERAENMHVAVPVIFTFFSRTRDLCVVVRCCHRVFASLRA